MNSRMETLLQYAIMAPSGDNCQPWKITVAEMKIGLHNDPHQDRSLYNLQQRASLIAHGAFLENLCMAAPAFGLQAQVELFPNPADTNHIATVLLSEGETRESPFLEAIRQRHTNREAYRPVNISDSQVACWKGVVEAPDQEVWIERHPEQVARLATLLSLNDLLVFEVPALHGFLFEQIRWTEREAIVTGDGLDIRTLGLNAVDRIAFRLLKNWGLIAGLNRLGFSKIVQKKSERLIRSSSALTIMTMSKSEFRSYVEGGRLWQRFLLQLASEGLCAQPIAGLACLMQSAHEGLLDKIIADRHRTSLLSTRKALISHIGGGDEDVILAIFRVGRGPQVTRALRRPLQAFLLS